MKTIKVKMIGTDEVKEMILVSRIDATLFECKSSSKKRKSDFTVHIDTILSDVSDVPVKGFDSVYESGSYLNSDEFEGLCQANQIGENPFKATILSR